MPNPIEKLQRVTRDLTDFAHADYGHVKELLAHGETLLDCLSEWRRNSSTRVAAADAAEAFKAIRDVVKTRRSA